MRKGLSSYEKRRERYGWCFILPWLLGTVIFFIVPLVKSVVYSFSDVSFAESGVVTSWCGMKNYVYALTADKDYSDCLRETLLETLWKTPLILVFSLFIAVILNQKFRGRAFARAVFFLPVIIATGPVYKIISGDLDISGGTGEGQFSTMFSADLIGELMRFLGIYGLSSSVTGWIQSVSDNIFNIVWSSGIQILLFLAALQNVPTSAREAAVLEGATGWEFFWKITFPYVSPFVLANFIFTAIDSFTNSVNPVMERISEMRGDMSFGYASAMTWIYFLTVLIGIGIAAAVFRKFIYYETE